MPPTQQILEIFRKQLFKGINHLSHSYQKVLKMTTDVEKLDIDQLEIWESFAARFARVSDIFLAKYVRTWVLQGDPAFRGSLRDFVDQAEKLGLIENADTWMEIRELRNASAHEYSEEKFSEDVQKMRNLTPILIALRDKLKDPL